jgi:hypothetical protein
MFNAMMCIHLLLAVCLGSDVQSPCPEVMCKMHAHCEYGFQQDANGCDVCSCNHDAVDPGQCTLDVHCVKDREFCTRDGDGTCRRYASLDQNCGGFMPAHLENRCAPGLGCDYSHADPRRSDQAGVCAECPEMMCEMHCEYGFQQDAHGCDVCSCNKEPLTSCSEVMCEMYCEYGFQQDANGCDVCSCNEGMSDGAIAAAVIVPILLIAAFVTTVIIYKRKQELKASADTSDEGKATNSAVDKPKPVERENNKELLEGAPNRNSTVKNIDLSKAQSRSLLVQTRTDRTDAIV